MAASVKTPVGDAPVIPLVILGIGGYLAWFGIHYWRSDVKYPTTPLKDVLQGNGITAAGTAPESYSAMLASDVSGASAQEAPQPGTSGTVTAIGQPNTPSSTGSQIADDALKYVGAGYVYGGNASKIGDWDCSSFVSYVLGHDLGMALPGGKWGEPGFPPDSHGPTTLTYLLFGTPVNNASVVAGDLVVYNTHMGIAIDQNNMVSAEDEQQGTQKATIAGMTQSLGEIPHFRRVS